MQKSLGVFIILIASISSICFVSNHNLVYSQVTSLGENFDQPGSGIINPEFSRPEENSVGSGLSNLDNLFSPSNNGINAESETIEERVNSVQEKLGS